MKAIKALLSIILCLAAGFSWIYMPAQTFSTGIVAQASSEMKISTKKKTVTVGQSFTLTVKGTKKAVKWSSSNKKVAVVNQNGRVTAKKEGTAKITGTVKGKSFTAKITVEKPLLESTSLLIEKGYTRPILIYNTQQKLTWTSSDKKVAVVDKNGNVTGVKQGSCTVKCTLECGTAYSVTVKVKNSITFKQKGIEGTVHINKDDGNLILGITNTNKKAVSVVITLSYCNKKGKQIATNKVDVDVIEKGKTYYTFTSAPTDDNFDKISYCDLKFNVETDSMKCKYTNTGAIGLTVKENKKDGLYSVKLKNNSLVTYSTVEVCIMYYDKSGKLIGYSNDYAFEPLKPNKTNSFEFYYPFNFDTGETIKPAKYAVYVNRAVVEV